MSDWKAKIAARDRRAAAGARRAEGSHPPRQGGRQGPLGRARAPVPPPGSQGTSDRAGQRGAAARRARRGDACWSTRSATATAGSGKPSSSAMYEFLDYQVQDVMSRPICVRGETTLAEAEALLEKHGWNGVPVVDEAERPVGFFTSLDLLKAFAFSEDTILPSYERILARPVSEVMSRDLVSVCPRTPLTRVLQKLVDTRSKSLPVHRRRPRRGRGRPRGRDGSAAPRGRRQASGPGVIACPRRGPRRRGDAHGNAQGHSDHRPDARDPEPGPEALLRLPAAAAARPREPRVLRLPRRVHVQGRPEERAARRLRDSTRSTRWTSTGSSAA